MSDYMNLYTFLIDINNRYVFGEFVEEKIKDGEILVNNKKPDDINMKLSKGDVVKIDGRSYIV